MKATGVIFVALGLVLSACEKASETHSAKESVQKSTAQELKIDYESFKLDNGLTVIFHIDRSDPVVAVALTSHVGSAMEKPGKTGFAHLFEHLLFLESENLGKGGLDKMSARIGGSGANGSTSRDRTNYFQTVPKDALEKMIWAEADKLGFFINTVTEQVLAKEKQVVKNEKRQSVDNRPYGHANYVIDKNLYDKNHPYNWQVIGSLQDLQNATLEDVQDFFRTWYTPNNVTLSIAGDFDKAQAKKWVHKYFDEIKRGPEIKSREKMPSQLDKTKHLVHEDNFARQPELRMVWPGVHSYHKDSYALDVLSHYLSTGKNAPLNKALIDKEKLTSRVTMFSSNSELAGEIQIITRNFEDLDLDRTQQVIFDALTAFEKDGISDKDLARIKAGQETAFYNGVSSVLGKGFQLAQYNIFAGDPGYINQDIKKILAVTSEDVMRVYNQYIKGKHYVASSFVPKSKTDLALDGSVKAEVIEEKIVQGAEKSFDASGVGSYEPTPSSFDRTVEPPYGESPVVNTPEIVRTTLSNGMKVLSIKNNELPLIQFSLKIKGGQLLDDINKVGVANLLGDLMNAGTKSKTRAELEEAIESLGASISVTSGREYLTLNGTSLSKNYSEVMKLVEEIILEPRFDQDELDLAKRKTISYLQQMNGEPRSIASQEFNRIVYGKDHIFSQNPLGSVQSIKEITIDDLKHYYSANLTPSLASFHVVGDIDQEVLKKSLVNITENWKPKQVEIPTYKLPPQPTNPKVYFYDMPGAKQSILSIGHIAISKKNPDYSAANAMNYILGGGGFASRLMQKLREEKGYTYGIGSRFNGSEIPGPFQITSGVRSNVTLESVKLVQDIFKGYTTTYNDEDHKVMQNFMLKSPARAFETLSAKLTMLHNIDAYDWSPDYVKINQRNIEKMTPQDVMSLAKTYIKPNEMTYVIVGDAATQMERLNALGLGNAVLLNKAEK